MRDISELFQDCEDTKGLIIPVYSDAKSFKIVSSKNKIFSKKKIQSYISKFSGAYKKTQQINLDERLRLILLGLGHSSRSYDKKVKEAFDGLFFELFDFEISDISIYIPRESNYKKLAQGLGQSLLIWKKAFSHIEFQGLKLSLPNQSFSHSPVSRSSASFIHNGSDLVYHKSSLFLDSLTNPHADVLQFSSEYAAKFLVLDSSDNQELSSFKEDTLTSNKQEHSLFDIPPIKEKDSFMLHLKRASLSHKKILQVNQEALFQPENTANALIHEISQEVSLRKSPKKLKVDLIVALFEEIFDASS